MGIRIAANPETLAATITRSGLEELTVRPVTTPCSKKKKKTRNSNEQPNDEYCKTHTEKRWNTPIAGKRQTRHTFAKMHTTPVC